MPAILINGQAAEHISVLDRGFQYGDGLFETLRVVDGKPRRWARHMARLAEGCQQLRIVMPEVELLQSEAIRLCADADNAVLKIILSRGVGERGYAPPAQTEVTRVLALSVAAIYPPELANEGVAVRVCNMRLSQNPALAGVKHLNRLEQVLARAEWDRNSEIAEGLMLDTNTKNNNVIEGTMSNLFCVQTAEQGTLLKTPALDRCGVKGVTRACIMDIAREEGFSVQESAISLDEVYQSKELFLCNTLIGIWPVRQLEEQTFPVGPVTTQLSRALESMHE